MKHPITEEDPQSRIDALREAGLRMEREIQALTELVKRLIREQSESFGEGIVEARIKAELHVVDAIVEAALAEPEDEGTRLQ